MLCSSCSRHVHHRSGCVVTATGVAKDLSAQYAQPMERVAADRCAERKGENNLGADKNRQDQENPENITYYKEDIMIS